MEGIKYYAAWGLCGITAPAIRLPHCSERGTWEQGQQWNFVCRGLSPTESVSSNLKNPRLQSLLGRYSGNSSADKSATAT